MYKLNNFFKFRYPDAIYFGEGIKNGKGGRLTRQGKGIMKYSSDRVFEGEWESD